MLHWGGSSALCGVIYWDKIIYWGNILISTRMKNDKVGKGWEQQYTQTIQPRIVWICFDSFDAL